MREVGSARGDGAVVGEAGWVLAVLESSRCTVAASSELLNGERACEDERKRRSLSPMRRARAVSLTLSAHADKQDCSLLQYFTYQGHPERLTVGVKSREEFDGDRGLDSTLPGYFPTVLLLLLTYETVLTSGVRSSSHAWRSPLVSVAVCPCPRVRVLDVASSTFNTSLACLHCF